ncbi:MAG: tetratricopeptide repeat protein [Chloroflexota bacterium]|nr:tetratricopeptide repeat protein [Chloroflexota bacterium]
MRRLTPVVVAALALSLAALGCGALTGRGPSLPLPFAPTATPTREPTPTPSSTPTPTPTPSPSELLTGAERAMHNGDYGSAADLYRTLLERPLDEATDAQARLGLGTAQLRDRAYAEAADAFRQVRASHPQTDLAHDASFLLGDALVGAGDPLSATEAYRGYLQAGTVITPYVNRSLGDAFRAAGDHGAAVDAYTKAVAEAPHRSFEVAAREGLALSHAALQNTSAAVEQYDAILRVAQQPKTRARIAHQAAETLLLAGQTEAGYARHLGVVQAYPEEGPAHRSLVRLVEAGRPVDDLLRGTVNYHAESYGPAVQALYRYIQAYPETHSGDAHWYAGLSFAEAGSIGLAINEFELLIDTHPQNRYRGEAWLELAEIYADQGEVDQAVATCRTFVDAAPAHRLAAEALWEAAKLLERSGDVQGAAAAYVDCREAYPASDFAPQALFRAGLQFHQLDQVAEATASWETLAQSYPDSDYRPAALLWLGKLAVAHEDPEGATAALERAAETAPEAYYGLRTVDIAASPQAPPFPSSTYGPRRGAGSQSEAEAWLADWLGLDEPGALSEPSPRLTGDGRLQRGLELWRLGRFQEAKEELEGLRADTYSDPLSQYQLALQYRDLGLYRSSILAAWRLIGLSPVTRTVDAPRFVVQLAYPTYYEDLVLENAERTGLDPLLIFSLIRQESLFESLATSVASAHGLMQVIPPTGAEIASEIGWPPNYETAHLYRPYVSLRFGTYYLAKQRDRFDGRIEVALAAYNGGPFNAQRWIERAGDDPDLFLETITLHEPQLYIKRIKEHLAVYRALYGG